MFSKDSYGKDEEGSLFASWARKYPSASEPGKPSLGLLGAGSDYAPFCLALICDTPLKAWKEAFILVTIWYMTHFIGKKLSTTLISWPTC